MFGAVIRNTLFRVVFRVSEVRRSLFCRTFGSSGDFHLLSIWLESFHATLCVDRWFALAEFVAVLYDTNNSSYCLSDRLFEIVCLHKTNELGFVRKRERERGCFVKTNEFLNRKE